MSAAMINVEIRDGVAPDLLRRIKKLQNRQGLHEAMAFAVEALIVKHISGGPAQKANKLGGTSTGFWQKAAGSTDVSATVASGLVRIKKRGVALQYFGGVVNVKQKPWLTIPIHAMAHGKSVKDLSMPLYRFTSSAGNEILATKPTKEEVKAFAGRRREARKNGEKAAKRNGGKMGYIGGIPVYVLKKSVTIPAHPEVLPPMDALRNAAVVAARDFVKEK